MTKRKPQILYESYYLTVYDDKTMSISDGVGYTDTVQEEETQQLLFALAKAFHIRLEEE